MALLKNKTEPVAPNEALEPLYGIEQPYTATIRLRGVTPFLFNRFSDLEGYAAERVAPKRKPRSAENRDYEAMVWRTEEGELAAPTAHIIASMLAGAKYFKSPISNSGSATNTLREALVPFEEYMTFGVSEWDCIDFRLERNGDIKRSPKPTWRPRLEVGWSLTAHVSVVTPELYGPAKLLEILNRAGTTSGIGDGRRKGMGRFVPDGMDIEDGLPW